jgi:hypothetical protein
MIVLTVTKPAFVSLTGCVTTIVEDESGQRVRLQVFNMDPKPEPTVDGIDALALQGRYVLKNPFLKVSEGDGWLGLRLDQPFDLERLDLPPLHGEVLTLTLTLIQSPAH